MNKITEKESAEQPLFETVLLSVLFIFYLLCLVYGVLWAYKSHTPCVTNFEGGCGYAKSLAFIFSIIAAVLSLMLGNLLLFVNKGKLSLAKNEFNLILCFVNLPLFYLAWCFFE